MCTVQRSLWALLMWVQRLLRPARLPPHHAAAMLGQALGQAGSRTGPRGSDTSACSKQAATDKPRF
jgi:hypothetical protein